MIRSTIRQYLILTAMNRFGVGFTAAVYVTFLISKGLNLFEVNLVNFVFFTTLFICEIPTGAFADVFGRKSSYVISCFLFALGMFVYSISTSFWGFAGAEAICAIAMTFSSGAFQAWLVDKLAHHGYEGTFTPIFAREQQISQGVGIVGAIIGATIADNSLTLPWIIGGFVVFTTGVTACLWMKEEYFVRQKLSFGAGLRSMKNITVTSVHYGFKNKVIRFILVIGAVQFIVVQAPNMQWQPFFKQFLKSQFGLGILWAGMALGLMVGAYLAPRFLKKFKDEKKTLILTQILVGLGIAGTVVWNIFPAAATIFILHEIARGMFKPIKDAYLHDNIPSRERATLISFESIAHHGGGMIGLLLSGMLAEYAGIRLTWFMAGLALILSALLVAKNGNKKT